MNWWRDGPAVAFAAVFPTVAAWFYFVRPADEGTMRIFYAAGKGVQFAFPALWVWLVQRTRPRWPLTRRGVGWGLGFGLLVVAAMLGLYHGYLKESPYLAGTRASLEEKLTQIGADTPAAFLAMAVFICVLHAAFEEYYWRWFVFGQLRRGLPPVPAGVLASLAFAAHHVLVLDVYLGAEHFWTATLFFALCVAAGGAVWAWLYHRTGSLSGPWLSHLLVDAGLMWIGYDLMWR
jgi:membrane protease YdiL (CAAX protease family)